MANVLPLIVLGGAALLLARNTKYNKARPSTPGAPSNVLVLRSMSEYQNVVKRGAFNRDTVVVLGLSNDSKVIAATREVAKNHRDVLYVVAVGPQVAKLPFFRSDATQKMIASVVGYSASDLRAGDPLSLGLSHVDHLDNQSFFKMWALPDTVDKLVPSIEKVTNGVLGSRSRPQTSSDEQAYKMLKRMSSLTGATDMDPDNRPIEDILLEIQLTFGIEPADGTWSEATYNAVSEVIEDHS